MKLGKLYYFEWCDAFSNDTWKSINDATEWFKENNCIVKQCGWLVYITDKELGFVARKCEWNFGEYENQWGLLQKIPKTWIKRVTEIKIKKES